MPLPPYIKEALNEKSRYQTVYGKVKGSSAAPTAGLHFTDELLGVIRQKGVNIADITLHVGLGTFRPVKESDISRHKMHSEQYFVPAKAANLINETRQSGGRVYAVGTTSARTLESVCVKSNVNEGSAAFGNSVIMPGAGETDIYIFPGYKFSAFDALITNFHLPKSTLLMLVSAFAGRESVLHAYGEAIKHSYRFFSFGDAMLII